MNATRLLFLGVLLASPLVGCATSNEPEFDETAAFARFCVGVSLETRGDYTGAREAYEEASTRGATNDIVTLAHARCLIAEGKTSGAYAALRQAWDRGDRNELMLRFLAELSFRIGSTDEAIRFNREVLLSEPGLVRPVFYLERVLTGLGREREMLGLLEALEHDPDVSLYLLDRLAILRERFDESLAER